MSFSHSPNVETTIETVEKEPALLRFFHSGNVLETDRSILPREFCLPGIEQALPEGFIEDGIPGLIGEEMAREFTWVTWSFTIKGAHLTVETL